MNTIVLFTNKFEWKPEEWTTLMNGYLSDNGQFIVETSDSWISVYKFDDVFSDYDENEEKLVKSLLHDPIAYLIGWRGDKLLKKFIDNFPLNIDAVIDNDHGLICKISELRGKLISDWIVENYRNL